MKTFFSALFLIIASQALAASGAALYLVDVPVSDNNETAALQTALQIMVDRLTPGENDHENPVIQAAAPLSVIRSHKAIKNQLHVEFDPQALYVLMNKAGQQPWLVNRPRVYVWVSQDLPGGRGTRFIYPEDAPIFFASLEKAARRKGLELVITSPYEFNPKGELYQHDHPIAEGLARRVKTLHPQAVLYVQLSYETNGYVYERWQAHYRDHTCFGNDQKPFPLHEIGDYAIEGSSKCFFEQGEEKHELQTSVFVNFRNLRTVQDYRTIAKYITRVPGVLQAHVHSVTEDAVLYKLDMRIPVSLLEMRLAKKFTPLPPIPEEGIINYQLNS